MHGRQLHKIEGAAYHSRASRQFSANYVCHIDLHRDIAMVGRLI